MNITGDILFTPAHAVRDVTESFPAHQIPAIDSRSLSLFLFTVGGVSYGIDADQIAEIAAYNGEKADDLFWLHEEMCYGAKTVSYHSPTVITIRTGMASSYRVIIDSMEDIAEFSHNDLTFFPTLLEPFVFPRGLWGILLRRGSMILLLDFKRLLRERTS